ncbi:MAG TPA: hypothetical protein VGE41_13820 [Verrucomicrobiae bacterium]|jgi:hypothetical protein
MTAMHNMTFGKGFSTLLISVALFSVSRINAADFALKVTDKPASKQLGESIGAVLQPKAIQLLKGSEPALEIWLRSDVPLKSKPASPGDALGAIAETTLVGAVMVSGPGFRDYKDNEIPKGTYTARFALQPQDGDHLGTAEFNYFLLLISADTDKELTGIKQFKPMTKASGKLTSSGHPVVISLRPASPESGLPKLTEPAAEHKAIRLLLPCKVADAGDKVDVALDLVYQGKGHIQ